jgi:hypothetical protein
MAIKKKYTYDSKGRLTGVEQRDEKDDERDAKGCWGLILFIFILMAFGKAC